MKQCHLEGAALDAESPNTTFLSKDVLIALNPAVQSRILYSPAT